MSAADRYANAPTPRPLSALSRPELAARIQQLRQALDLLWSQSKRDGGPAYGCIGQMKISLLELERDLFKRDRAAQRGEPLPLPVALALAGRGEG
jgi:hypothetical protein